MKKILLASALAVVSVNAVAAPNYCPGTAPPAPPANAPATPPPIASPTDLTNYFDSSLCYNGITNKMQVSPGVTSGATYTQSTVSVPTTISTPVAVAGSATRALFIQPPAGVTGCTLDLTGNGATPASMPLGAGWSFDHSTPVSIATVSVYCPTATQISVTKGN